MALGISLPSINFIIKVAITIAIISLALRFIPQLEPIRRMMTV